MRLALRLLAAAFIVPATRDVAGVFAQSSTRERAEEALAHLAHHDALTGVADRAMLTEQVERELAVAQRRGGRLAVVFIDLDALVGTGR